MFAALGFSLLFTFLVAPLAAKSKKAERVIIPALDILQSVPVLGFLTFTVVFFMGLFPGSQLGAELAAIFAIFTSQAWNMTFSFYQSLKTVPRDLEEITTHLQLSPLQRFWKLDAPFATPGLVWNMMVSMSGGWFFVVASEAISVGDTKITLPGIGSYLALAISEKNIEAVAWAVGAMGVVIVLYDQLLFRPIVAWADKFSVELVAAQEQPKSWVLDVLRRTRLVQTITGFLSGLIDMFSGNVRQLAKQIPEPKVNGVATKVFDWAYNLALLGIVVWAACFGGFLCDRHSRLARRSGSRHRRPHHLFSRYHSYRHRKPDLGAHRRLCRATAGLSRARTARGAVPCRLSGECSLSLCGRGYRDLSPQPRHLAVAPHRARHAVVHPLQCYRGRQRLSRRSEGSLQDLPAEELAVVAQSDFAWDISLLRHGSADGFRRLVERQHRRGGGELGDTKLEAHGLGAYIANATEAGDFHRVVLGIGVMCVFVVILNRALWRRLYVLADRRLRIQ